MFQIDNEKFGTFLCEMRKQKNMTQKELAEKLFVSDKTVSKWERGFSMPHVALLIPIAETLGINVTELLKGEASDNTENNSATPLDKSIHDAIRNTKKKWGYAYFISVFVVIAEALLLIISNISFQETKDSLYIAAMMLLFAGWFCIFAKDVLPAYYDKNKINYVTQGIFKIHMTGLSFHNGNWPHICTVFRVFTLGTALLSPALCLVSIIIGGGALWDALKYVFIIVALIAMTVAAYVVGKRYE